MVVENSRPTGKSDDNCWCFRQRGAVPAEDDAALELHRLHAQLHDCLPRPLWGVDRVDVGLHVSPIYFLKSKLVF